MAYIFFKKKYSKKKLFYGFSSNKRISALFIFFSLLGGIVLSRFFDIQVRRYGLFLNKAKAQHSIQSVLESERGKILAQDKNGKLYPVAANKDVFYIYVSPKEITEKDQTAEKLSLALNLRKEDIFPKINKTNDPFEIIASKVSDEKAEEIKRSNIKGVYLGQKKERTYPLAEAMSYISGFVGFLGDSRVGQYGLEGFYDNYLEGLPGLFEGESDIWGRWTAISDRIIKKPKNGSDLILTVEPNIQVFIYEKLKAAMEKWKSPSGMVIVADPKTGKILALVNIPSFDPNNYSSVDDFKKFINPAISGLYEPGSIIKPITMASAIDAGVIEPDTVYEDKGILRIGGYTIRNFDNQAYGKKTMTEVLELSLNTGAVFAANQMTKSDFFDYFTRFGFSELTGIDLIGETSGNLKNLEKQIDINYATASFGQGIAVTPMEMITAFSAIANGGKIMQPYIVEKIISTNQEITAVKAREKRRIISKQSANKVRDMLVSVGKSKFYKKARISGYSFAVKTGTAQVPGEEGGYSEDVIHSFIGFAPAYDPEFILMIKIDKPQGNRFASNTLSPVFKEIMSYLLNYYHIPPDDNL